MRLSSRLPGATFAAAALLVLGVALAAAQDPRTIVAGGSQITKPSQGTTAPGVFSGTKVKPGTVTRVMGASVSVDCGDGRKVSASTGTDSGNCDVTTIEGKEKIRQVSCSDGKGNTAEAHCSSNGMGGCDATAGHGSCTEQ